MIPVNTISGGENMERAILYRPPSRELYDYLQNNYQSALSYIQDTGSQFMANVKDLYNRFTSSEAIANAKATLMNAGIHFSQDVIYPLEYNRLNQANLMMQRYMMSHPKVSNLYKKHMVYGFQDTWIDREPNTYGEDRYDYGRVMDGVLQFDSEGNGYIEYFIQNDEDIYGELELTERERDIILDMYDLVNIAIANGLDPTDPNNSMG